MSLKNRTKAELLVLLDTILVNSNISDDLEEEYLGLSSKDVDEIRKYLGLKKEYSCVTLEIDTTSYIEADNDEEVYNPANWDVTLKFKGNTVRSAICQIEF